MRHRKRRTRFGRQRSHRIATLKNLARSVLLHQRIKTTHIKAKEAKKLIDKLITIAKNDSVAARRKAFSILKDRALVSKLFKETAPLFSKRQGGYTRIIPFGFRKGDGASTVFLELTEKKAEEKQKVSKRMRKSEKAAPEKQEAPRPREEKPKPAPDLAPEIKEEKTIEEAKKEKAKDETKKITKQKGLLKKVKGFFRRRTHM